MTVPQAGYTLPVFACAAAVAALQTLETGKAPQTVTITLLDPDELATIPIEQAAPLAPHRALAITRSDPGENLDLTRHTPVWAEVQYTDGAGELVIQGGEGIGKQANRGDAPAIYQYAQRLLTHHLTPYLRPHQTLTVTLILPEGRTLATRTSNAAFGVVEGLSLLGTTGIAQPLSAPQQLILLQTQLQAIAAQQDWVVYCVGENGLDLAQKWGIQEHQRLKTANWIGPMLVAAAELGLQNLLLLGYHGKLIKLAGGIFHTHHHLADGRAEILTAQAVQAGLPYPQLQELFQSPTTEAGLALLRSWETPQTPWVQPIYQSIANTIDHRAQAYVYKLTQKTLTVGSILFDGDRQPLALSTQGQHLAQQIGLNIPFKN